MLAMRLFFWGDAWPEGPPLLAMYRRPGRHRVILPLILIPELIRILKRLLAFSNWG